MTADEMFERLKFYGNRKENSNIYIKEDEYENKARIKFSEDKNGEFIDCDFTFNEDNAVYPYPLTIEELQAIVQKCKELGWTER